MTPVILWPASVGGLDDCPSPTVCALFDAIPEIVGHGETEAEAVDDLLDQLEAVTWH